MANQLNRRFLRGDSAVTCSSFFLSIKYANELPNWTTTQLGVLLDVASTTPSSWVVARRIVSPMLMLMSSSLRSGIAISSLCLEALGATAWQQ